MDRLIAPLGLEALRALAVALVKIGQRERAAQVVQELLNQQLFLGGRPRRECGVDDFIAKAGHAREPSIEELRAETKAKAVPANSGEQK